MLTFWDSVNRNDACSQQWCSGRCHARVSLHDAGVAYCDLVCLMGMEAAWRQHAGLEGVHAIKQKIQAGACR